MKTLPSIRGILPLVALASALLIGACGSSGESADPLFCESSADCAGNAEATFCDIDKGFPGTSHENGMVWISVSGTRLIVLTCPGSLVLQS